MKNNSPHRVLGIDPGLSETGWAVLESVQSGVRLIASGCIRTGPGAPLPQRLDSIHREVAGLLDEHEPKQVAIEEMFFMKAAHTVRATLQARGVVLLAAAQRRKPIAEYNPKQVKVSLTGSGNAQKAQMQRMVQATLGLADRLRPDDVADAAAIALCHLRSSRLGGWKILDSVGRRPRLRKQA